MAKNAAQLLYGPVIVTILFYFHFNVIILGIFYYLQANWYKAEQYCRYHGMHLASVGSEAEQRDLQEHITSFGLGNKHFWSSGTDQVRYSQLNFTILTAFRQRRASSSGCPPASR